MRLRMSYFFLKKCRFICIFEINVVILRRILMFNPIENKKRCRIDVVIKN